ncbi:NPCBM/NEW2 domain-containing protein [Streptomyces roseolus]|uniref:NPCBM/NEW2 domain-containing protein n=1 Tax=Streptomyces roseolus TaxID=67358 RepID=UPI0033E97874
MSALTAVAGLLLGFFGLPTVFNSPTARPSVVTVTAPPPSGTTDAPTTDAPTTDAPATDPVSPSSGPESVEAPSPLPTGSVALKDLTPLGDWGSDEVGLSTSTLGGKTRPNSIVLKYPCQGSVEYGLNQRYKRLTFVTGLDDNSVATPGKLIVTGDGKPLKSVMLEINRPQTVTVDLTGVIKLGIGADIRDGAYCTPDGVVVVLAEALITS